MVAVSLVAGPVLRVSQLEVRNKMGFTFEAGRAVGERMEELTT